MRIMTLALALLAAAPAPAATLRIGVLNDMTGPYADVSGPASVEAAKMAAEDFAREADPGAPTIEILSADHQNKPDVGAAIARQWVDRDNVAAVVDVPNSAVALAVNQVMREKDRAFLASSSATSDLTGKQCAPTTVQWVFDTWALANGSARAVVQQGGDSWFFIVADYAFGQALERDASAVVTSLGGKVLGDVRHPIGSADFSSLLLAAQASGAKVIGLANSGNDTSNTMKQAAEFGIGRDGKQVVAGLLVFLTDIDALGLQAAQGMVLTEAFYWDQNEATRAWSQRFAARTGGRMPTMNHAGVYSGILAYLRATAKAGLLEQGVPSGAAAVVAMRQAPIDDALFGRTVVRPDGRAVHAMYLFRVKSPAESKGRWDYYLPVATIPAEQAFRPFRDGGCPLIQ